MTGARTAPVNAPVLVIARNECQQRREGTNTDLLQVTVRPKGVYEGPHSAARPQRFLRTAHVEQRGATQQLKLLKCVLIGAEACKWPENAIASDVAHLAFHEARQVQHFIYGVDQIDNAVCTVHSGDHGVGDSLYVGNP